MPQDVWTPMITSDHSLRNKSLRAHNKVAHVELLRGLVPRYAVTVIYINQQRKKKRFFVFQQKNSKAKNNKDIRKIVISDQMQKQNRISDLRKKRAKPKTKITTNFGTSLPIIAYRMRCAIYTPLMQKTSQYTLRCLPMETGPRQ